MPRGGSHPNQFLNNLDGVAMALIMVLFMVALYRVMAPKMKVQHALWFGASAVLLPVTFMGARDYGLLHSAHLSTFALLGLWLMASGFWATRDPESKITPYLTLYLAGMTLIYAYAAHYGAVTGQILRGPAFVLTFVPAMAILILVPLQGKSPYRYLVSAAGVLITIVGYMVTMIYKETMTMSPVDLKVTIYGLISLAILFLTLGLGSVKEWQPWTE